MLERMLEGKNEPKRYPSRPLEAAAKKLTDDLLPPLDTKRWVIRRKAEVVAGVRCGLISLDEACRRYGLSMEEFLSWQRLIDRYGMPGLRATQIQKYRIESQSDGSFKH